MKSIHVISLCLSLLLTSCSSFTLPRLSQTASPTSSHYLLADPSVGLDQLEHYRNTLTITYQSQLDSQSSEAKTHIDNAVWHQQSAAFTIIDDQDEAGQPQHLLFGYFGQAAYDQLSDSDGCEVTWGAVSPGTGMLDPSSLIPALLSGNNQGEASVDGIVAHHFRLDASSLGLSEGQATGDVWIAAQGGFVVKYQLEIQGGPDVLGQGLIGTRIYNYAISEVNNGAPVSYPNGCEPVLSEVPMLSDALNEERVPGALSFTTGSTEEEVGDFYDKFFTQNGWNTISQPLQDAPYALWVYGWTNSDEVVTVARDQDQGFAWVTVNMEGSLNPSTAPAGIVTPNEPTTTAAPGENPQAHVQDSLTLLIGSQDTPSVLPSFTFKIDLVLPEGLPQQSESLNGEAETGTFHFSGSYFGMQVEAWRTLDGQFLNESGSPDSGVGLPAWLNWQTIATSAVQTVAMAAIDSGAETVGGRPAEAFTVTGAGSSSDASGVPGNMGIAFSDMQGKIWVDRATGALLKADLTFQIASILTGMSNQPGKGSLTIQVDQVGQTKVTLPR
jgi:hypothetical protein